MRPFDYHYILVMMKFQVEILCDSIEKGYEVDETKNPKIQKMKRFIELANNQLIDEYADRCGIKFDYKTEFVPIPDTEQLPKSKRLYTMERRGGSQSDDEIAQLIIKSRELQDEEWNEMIDLLKEAREWWT